MQTLSLDLETYSDVDLVKCGVYRYCESPNFEILLFGYAVDDRDVQVIDLARGEKIPEEILAALTDDAVTKWAFNANFERICLSHYLRDQGVYLAPFHDRHPLSGECAQFLDPAGWKCSMVLAAYNGLPFSLKDVGKVLNLGEQKLDEGKALIRYFSMPCKPTKANGGRTRNKPSDAPEKWETFKAYNRRDVAVETAIHKRLKHFPVPNAIWDEYHLDQKINDRGILIDHELVTQAIRMDAISHDKLIAKLKEKTGLENPNSVMQMKAYLEKNGLKMESLGKKEVAAAIRTAPPALAEILVLRQQLAKSSVKKYQAMANAACADGRVRGMYRFYGANRTGRWASRLINVQNLPQNRIPDLAAARALVKSGDYEMTTLLYGDVPDTLSQLIRTALVPSPGRKFIVSDFSAIEARVIAWLAGEKWKSAAFARGEDIYCSTASRMFGVPVVKHGVNGALRQKGKIAELACGYGGSVGALKAMGALDMGLKEEELPTLVESWRAANPNIVQLWWDVDRCVTETVKHHVRTATRGITFTYKSGMMFIALPSGRQLAYAKPRMGLNRFGSESVTYEGIGPGKKWERIESYGPKFVENIVQAISRDILAYAMKTLRCCDIVGHVHDELIIECDKGVSLEAVCEQMGRTPQWAEGLKLKADGYECRFYMKE